MTFSPIGSSVALALTMLLVGSCAKQISEPVAPTPPPHTDLVGLGESFIPPYDSIFPLIKRFNDEKRAFSEGARDSSETKTLSEAVWTAEADANYWRGDALVVLDSALIDSVIFQLPLDHIEEGEWHVTLDAIIQAQQYVLDQVAVDLAHPIQYIDMSIKELTAEEATILVSITKRYDVPDPPPHPLGCFYLESIGTHPASDVMQQWLDYDEWERTGSTYDYQPSFYTAVSGWKHLTPIVPYGLFNGYVTYLGTTEDNNGPGWIAQGPSYVEVCFPEYWDKYLQLEQWYFDTFGGSTTPGAVLINRLYYTTYAPLIGGPMNYGSPWYPMGPYRHNFMFRRGIWTRH